MTAAPLPYAFARQHRILVRPGAQGLEAACTAATRSDALIEARRVAGAPLRIVTLSDDRFGDALEDAYRDGGGAAGVVAGSLDLAGYADPSLEPDELLDSADDAPIIRLLNAILATAIRDTASDVHIETFERRVRVRMRIDGLLVPVLDLHRAVGPRLVSRVKVMAQLDIAERRVPQDGRIAISLAGRSIDLRISTLPSAHGERVVLRLLDKRRADLDFDSLGMPQEVQRRFVELIERPHGILLVTGPTGSGKTTTLYAALQRLRRRQHNIMTVEEPIEYSLDGINQTQVNPNVEMTFARGLRAILRQDPDVIMVGEIRDLETAEIAVRASLTGHLVLSTLHTNTAIGAVSRLRDIGVEAYLLSSCLLGVMAQGLVRVLCGACKRPAEDGCGCDAAGCPACRDTGFRGRMGVFELIGVDPRLRALIHDGASEHALADHVSGQRTGLYDAGLALVAAGLTTRAEVLRMTEAAPS